MTHRFFAYGLLTLVVLGASGLITIVFRNPDTHGHLWDSMHEGYARTAVDEVRPADIDTIKSQLVQFRFPPPPPQYMAHETGPGSAVGSAVAARPGEAGSPEGTGPEAGTPDAQKIVLSQSEFQFDQTEIRLKAGVPVELVVTNEGRQVHGIWVPDLAISEEIRSGRSRTFKFTPEEVGRMRFTCSYNLCGTDEEHARMTGYIVVEP